MLQTAALGADLGESGYCTAIPTNCCVPGGRHGGYCQTLVKKIKKKSQPLGDISDPSALKLGCASSGGNHPHGYVLCPQVHLSCRGSLLQRCSEDVMCMGLAVWEPVHILLVSLQATFLNASEQWWAACFIIKQQRDGEGSMKFGQQKEKVITSA